MNEAQSTTARETVLNFVAAQVKGASEASMSGAVPLPKPDETKKITIPEEHQRSAFFNPDNGLPIVRGTEPRFVFGTGVLHPPKTQVEEAPVVDELETDDGQSWGPQFSPPEFEIDEKKLVEYDVGEDFSLERSQDYRPSAMGLSASILPGDNTILSFEVTATIYEKIGVKVEGLKNEQSWWVPNRISESVSIPWEQIKKQPGVVQGHKLPGPLGAFASLQTRVALPPGSAGEEIRTLTAVVKHDGQSDSSLFQFEMRVSIQDAEFLGEVGSRKWDTLDEEAREIEFQYRHVGTFAVGHGVGANWRSTPDGTVNEIWTESIPVHYSEVLSTGVPGHNLSMADLASADSATTKVVLQKLVDDYTAWIDSQEELVSSSPTDSVSVGMRLVERARHLASRMQKGVVVLTSGSNPNALKAFQMANKAMLLQQQRGRVPLRPVKYSKNQPLAFPDLVLPEPEGGRFGEWRPFQLGFLLLAVSGLVDALDPSRDEADLLFFPTGGGKTEAYLGAAAITMFYRRMEDPSHSGVDVLMRYTLRLLTIQQFERSAGLIVAMEYLRRGQESLLGATPFSIGVWLGNETTPNRRADAVAKLRKKGMNDAGPNPFVLRKCPWCGAQFTYLAGADSWVGYRAEGSPKTLRFVCADKKNCEFSSANGALPIWITDDDVYDERPSFILGTVDKFARLAWEPRARALFNRGEDGHRKGLPPALIIQDELHLISGPLGSLVGLYEAVIDELCCYEIEGQTVRPKIIASTATTRRFREQVLDLFGREETALFPQSITRANDTFFSSVATEDDGSPKKGTAYVGLNPATYQTGQVAASQVAAAVSQAPTAWNGPQPEIDYYTTAVWFFNSLKELGQTLTLMQSTVMSLLSAMWRDARIPGNNRHLEPMMELTGRVSAAEVAGALERLALPTSEKNSVTTCLASSIMEVGVDVQRLGLLIIMGQPKMTAQYIQVSGRVGRDRENGPGLVFMLYNPGRARDRSIFEQFRSYHQRLYAQVEPLSVTPFAPQTLEKGLEGAAIAYYRMTTPIDASPTDPDEAKLSEARAVLERRAQTIGAPDSTLNDLAQAFDSFTKRWKSYRPAKWAYTISQENGTSEDMESALFRARAESLKSILDDRSRQIPVSMRSVDSQAYLRPESNAYAFWAEEESQ